MQTESSVQKRLRHDLEIAEYNRNRQKIQQLSQVVLGGTVELPSPAGMPLRSDLPESLLAVIDVGVATMLSEDDTSTGFLTFVWYLDGEPPAWMLGVSLTTHWPMPPIGPTFLTSLPFLSDSTSDSVAYEYVGDLYGGANGLTRFCIYVTRPGIGMQLDVDKYVFLPGHEADTGTWG
jgi:hypothetical protein